LLPSVFRDPKGDARFTLPIPKAFLKDLAIKHLIEREARYGGFEYPTRAFFDAHLEPGDMFIYVGAHWGMLSLSAATRHPGEISADPANVTQLLRGVAHNQLTNDIETVAAAAGDKPGKSAAQELVAELKDYGFTLHQLPSHELGGALLRFAPGQHVCNVICLRGQFKPYRAYNRPAGPVVRPGASNRTGGDAEDRARLSQTLMGINGSEGVRWAYPTELLPGADHRASLAAQHILPGASVMDLGAGAMRLQAALPPGCKYLPIDLVRFTEIGEVLDLNQGQFPERSVDTVAALEVMQYIHDVPALLRRCAAAAPNLILSYPLAATDEASEARRREGWFNDFDKKTLIDMLGSTGWEIDSQEPVEKSQMFTCRRKIKTGP
jgi:hypothetical protein